MRRYTLLCLAAYLLGLLAPALHHEAAEEVACSDCHAPGIRLEAGCHGPCETPDHHHHGGPDHDHATCPVCKKAVAEGVASLQSPEALVQTDRLRASRGRDGAVDRRLARRGRAPPAPANENRI